MSEVLALLQYVFRKGGWLLAIAIIAFACTGTSSALASTSSAALSAKSPVAKSAVKRINIRRAYRRTKHRAFNDCMDSEIKHDGAVIVECAFSYANACERDYQFPTKMVHCPAHYTLHRNIPSKANYLMCDTTMTYVQLSSGMHRLRVRWVCSDWESGVPG